MSTALTVAAKAHATLGASVAARWMNCPGSVRLAATVPEGTDSGSNEHAREGTAAHALAELALRKECDPYAFLGVPLEGVEVTEEMVEHVRVFVTFCRDAIADFSHHWIEQRFSLAALNPPVPMFGTADFVAYDERQRALLVADLKYGKGVVVEVTNNVQLRYYALGAALLLGKPIDSVEMVIVQPRVGHPDGTVRSEKIDYLELLAFATELLDAARATLEPNAPLAAGAHCRWCPAAGICPEQRQHALAVAQSEFDTPFVPPAPETLTVEQLGDMLTKVEILEDWVRAMRSHAERLLRNGVEVPGLKLVERRPRRQWTNEEDVRAWLAGKGYAGDDVEERKLKSPAQVEKVLGRLKKFLPDEFITKKSSGVTLALDHDARPAVSLSAGSEFTALPSVNDSQHEPQ